jgi:hypothetical protein
MTRSSLSLRGENENQNETRILSFDIGIRNLAWCLMGRNTDVSGSGFTIYGWENVNLLESSIPVEKISCHKCTSKAAFTSPKGTTCGRHVPSEYPVLRDASGVVWKKIPAQKLLKPIFVSKAASMPKTREATIQKLGEWYSLPIEKVKQKKAVDTELSILHNAIRAFVERQRSLFATATAIHLENQPVLKNPTMKTVQILLYATLRDLLMPNPPLVRLVHAGVKVKGKQAGDKGYKERKQGSEEKTADLLAKGKIQEAARWQGFLKQHSKQNDLTDAFCMCVDALS